MADPIDTRFAFTAICRKKVSAAFDGGRLSSDGGVLLLAQAERRMGMAARLAGCIADPRDQSRVDHDFADMIRVRMLAIACGYEDCDDLDSLRHDPAFKLALGKLPDGAVGLASQPTLSRFENAPTTRELVRLMGVMVDLYCASYAAPPKAVTLDIDESVDVVHGAQQLSFWNGYYGERCFLPVHVYDTASGRPVGVLLRTGKTASGHENRAHVRRLIRRIRRHWPRTKITLRGERNRSRLLLNFGRLIPRTGLTVTPASRHCRASSNDRLNIALIFSTVAGASPSRSFSDNHLAMSCWPMSDTPTLKHSVPRQRSIDRLAS